MNPFKYTCIASIVILTACASPKAAFEASALKNRTGVEHESKAQHSAAALTSFELSGAIAAKNHKKGWTASLNWLQQGPNAYQIRLFGPLGGGTIIIEKHGSLITYRDGAKKLTSTKADELLQRQTGIRLPVNNLYYWVRGIPAPGPVHAATHDQNNHLVTLKQAGYIIDYTSYTSTNNMTLPSKIRLQGHDIMIKLVIKHWTT